MPRNDGNLWSGMSSPKKREIEQQKTETKKEDPRIEDVFKLLDDMQQEILAVNHFDIDASTPDEVVRRQIQRNKDRYADLQELKKRLKKLLGMDHA